MATGRPKGKARGPMRLDLGRADYCLDVKSLKRSHAFYNKLGFTVIGGNPAQGWLILRRGEFRLGLYEGHIDQNVINFRGGHVGKIVEAMAARGLRPFNVRGLQPSGRGSAMVKDPDGNVLFFDSSPHERAARRRVRK